MYVVNISSLHLAVDPGCRVLKGAEMGSVPVLHDAWLRFSPESGLVEDYGCGMPDAAALAGHEVVDARGGCVIPTFCDSHTHIIYAGSREGEFIDKINGLSYEEIAARGGGILNSADRVAAASEDSLYDAALSRASEMIAKGTGAFEVKSGYGLSTDSELKLLRVAARLREALPVPVKITFLGAHAVGRAYAGRQGAYVDMLVDEMLPAVAAQGLAEYVDVFCDRGFFTVDETRRILEASAHYGLRPKIHANELDCSGGVQVGVEAGALSVDHLERMGDAEIEVLRSSTTIPTMLPGASFFLGMPYAPARKAVAAGLPVALASDYNPGSSPSGDMRFVWALGCIKMRLTPSEALAACTINGAAAMGISDTHGAIRRGCPASFVVTRNVPSIDFIPYAYTTPWIADIYLSGRRYQ